MTKGNIASTENNVHTEPSIIKEPINETPFISLTEDFMSEELLTALSTYVKSAKNKFVDSTTKNRKTLYFVDFGYKYGETKHSPAQPADPIKSLMAAVKQKLPESN